jgi:hypothetical protein
MRMGNKGDGETRTARKCRIVRLGRDKTCAHVVNEIQWKISNIDLVRFRMSYSSPPYLGNFQGRG